jgi:hypothetical protein
MLELLLKEIRAGREEIRIHQAKMEANRKTDNENFLAKMDANRAKADADRVQTQEFMKTLQAYQAKTKAVLPAIQVTETSRKEPAAAFERETEVKMMACQEMEARPEEEKPTSADRKPEAAKQRKAPGENATVMLVREPKTKRCKDRKLAAQHRRQKTNTSTRENCGPQKDLPSPTEGQHAVRRWHRKRQ